MVSGTGHELSPEAAAAIFDLSPDAILVVDIEGHIRRANNQAEILFGYTRRQLEKMIVEDLIPDHLRKIHEDHRADYLQDPKTRSMGQGLRLFALRSNGEQIRVDASLAPIVVPNGEYVIVTVRRHEISPADVNRIPELFRVVSGKNPFQAWVMIFLVLTAAPLVVGRPPPTSVQSLVPEWAVILWAGSLGLSAFINALGIYWRGTIEISIWMELSSCVVFSVANLLYPVALILFALDETNSLVTPASVWFTAGTTLAFTVASVGRIYQLMQDRREVEEWHTKALALGVKV